MISENSSRKMKINSKNSPVNSALIKPICWLQKLIKLFENSQFRSYQYYVNHLL